MNATTPIYIWNERNTNTRTSTVQRNKLATDAICNFIAITLLKIKKLISFSIYSSNLKLLHFIAKSNNTAVRVYPRMNRIESINLMMDQIIPN